MHMVKYGLNGVSFCETVAGLKRVKTVEGQNEQYLTCSSKQKHNNNETQQAEHL